MAWTSPAKNNLLVNISFPNLPFQISCKRSHLFKQIEEKKKNIDLNKRLKGKDEYQCHEKITFW